MSEPFLILHKVRGAPAFDIAERNDDMGTPSDPGPWWIIPTSGHRAYPYSIWLLNQLVDFSKSSTSRPTDLPILLKTDAPMWEAHPDHYQVSMARSRLATAAGDLLSILGLGRAKPQEPVKRRVIP
jgi:hypothetical protein